MILLRRELIWVIVIPLLTAIVGYRFGASSAEGKVFELRSELDKLRAEPRRDPRAKGTSPAQAILFQQASPGEPVGPDQTSIEEFRARAEEFARRGNAAHVAEVAAKYDAEDTRTFLDLGLSPDQVERFKSNKVQLHWMALRALDPQQALMQARAKYDREIETALGQENYAKYRRYEESKVAVRELEQIESYALAQGKPPIDSKYHQVVADLIHETGATTTESWNGPYDPPPRPLVGKKMVAQGMRERLSRLQESVDLMRLELSQSEIPQMHQELLTSYYLRKIEEENERLALLARPTEDIIATQLEYMRQSKNRRE